ncbi:MAG: hypothetical protein OSA98_11815 [Rubripirellula sp.]|nr:hypothetical protein [Rubripirellula sp.]
MELRSISEMTVDSHLNRAVPPMTAQQLAATSSQNHAASLSSSRLEPSFGDVLQMEETLGTRLEADHASESKPTELEEKFTEFVGQTLFGSMLVSMRKTLGKPAYMHGGRTEEVFQKQLDQLLVEDLTKASGDMIAKPMFDLFNMQQRS